MEITISVGKVKRTTEMSLEPELTIDGSIRSMGASPMPESLVLWIISPRLCVSAVHRSV
jgi:hypothetical protein